MPQGACTNLYAYPYCAAIGTLHRILVLAFGGFTGRGRGYPWMGKSRIHISAFFKDSQSSYSLGFWDQIF